MMVSITYDPHGNMAIPPLGRGFPPHFSTPALHTAVEQAALVGL